MSTHLVPRREGVSFLRGLRNGIIPAAALWGCGLVALWWFLWH